MAREIKFRAWDGNEMHRDWMVFTEERGETVARQLAKKAAVVMQFTGLKDKNGKEIYEGDVVKLNDERYEIFFDSGEFQGKDIYDIIGGSLQMFELINGEVIGNIYENKDLLI